MRLVSDVGNASFEDVVPENHFEADEVQRRQVHRADKEKPVDDRYECLREQDKIRTCDGGDGTTGSEDGVCADECMAYRAKNRTGEIKTQIAEMAEPVVDVVAEQIQEEHISDDVHKRAVEKSVTYKLPQMRVNGREHKLRYPGSKGKVMCVWVYVVLQKKNKDIGGYQGVICVRSSAGPYARANR